MQESALTPANFNKSSKRLIIGISGTTSGGKTTVSKLLKATFPWASVIHQDAYFHPNDPKFHVYLPSINYFNWELETAINFTKLEQDLEAVLMGDSSAANVSRFFHNSNFVKRHKPDKAEVDNYANHFSGIQLVILEGHIIFNRKLFNDICNLKFFITLDKDECWKRRQEREYNPPPPPAFFEACVWPSYMARFKEVQNLDGIRFIDAKDVKLVEIYEEIKGSIVDAMKLMTL